MFLFRFSFLSLSSFFEVSFLYDLRRFHDDESSEDNLNLFLCVPPTFAICLFFSYYPQIIIIIIIIAIDIVTTETFTLFMNCYLVYKFSSHLNLQALFIYIWYFSCYPLLF